MHEQWRCLGMQTCTHSHSISTLINFDSYICPIYNGDIVWTDSLLWVDVFSLANLLACGVYNLWGEYKKNIACVSIYNVETEWFFGKMDHVQRLECVAGCNILSVSVTMNKSPGQDIYILPGVLISGSSYCSTSGYLLSIAPNQDVQLTNSIPQLSKCLKSIPAVIMWGRSVPESFTLPEVRPVCLPPTAETSST